MLRQDLTGSFTQTDSANRKYRDRGVEDHANYKDYPTGNDSHGSAIDKSVKVACRQRVQIDLKIPAQREQGKDPKIVAAKTTTDSLPFRNREVWRYQIGCQVIGPGLILWGTIWH